MVKVFKELLNKNKKKEFLKDIIKLEKLNYDKHMLFKKTNDEFYIPLNTIFKAVAKARGAKAGFASLYDSALIYGVAYYPNPSKDETERLEAKLLEDFKISVESRLEIPQKYVIAVKVYKYEKEFHRYHPWMV
ncbi:MAG: hypothetical protein V1839_03185 [archaeon]